MTRLLDGDGFGEIARLVDVATTPHGDVIGEHLQRDNFQDRRDQFGRRGNLDHMIGGFADELIAFGNNGNHDAVAGFHFLQALETVFS